MRRDLLPIFAAAVLKPSGAFSPRSISGLVGWWDASDLSTLFQSSAGSGAVAANNDPVGYWGDKSGNGYHLLQSTDNSRPAWVTGNGVQTDGSNDHMVTATISPAIPFTAETVFLVFKNNAAVSNERGFSQSAGASSDYGLTGHYIPLARSGAGTGWGAYASSGFRATVTVAAATKALLVATHSGSAIVNRVNGSAGSSYSHALNLSIDKFGIGRPVGDTVPLSQVTIYEMLVYSKLITGSELTAIESYLNARWGVY